MNKNISLEANDKTIIQSKIICAKFQISEENRELKSELKNHNHICMYDDIFNYNVISFIK